MSTKTKSAVLRIRLEPEHHKRLTLLAAADDRTLSDYARLILTAHLKASA